MTEQGKDQFSPEAVVEFWLSESVRKQWFRGSQALDDRVRADFYPYWDLARTGGLDSWSASSIGLLALIIIFDQFPRNMFRQQDKAYLTSEQAVSLTKQVLKKGLLESMSADWQQMCLMPLMHSENLGDQDLGVESAKMVGLSTQWFEHHRNIVKKFGRFPHRNAVLKRESTAEEVAYLNSKESFSA